MLTTTTDFVFPSNTLVRSPPSSLLLAVVGTGERPLSVYCHIPVALFFPFPLLEASSCEIYRRLVISTTEMSLGVVKRQGLKVELDAFEGVSAEVAEGDGG